MLSRAVPFNAPHHFRILKISPGAVQILLPYKRVNLNHLKGIHACALATLCEYTIGLTLISKISENKFRFILKNLNLEYHYQAKMDVSAEFRITDGDLNELIISPLNKIDAVFQEFEIKVTDISGNHICTGKTNWQIKKWDKVQSKI